MKTIRCIPGNIFVGACAILFCPPAEIWLHKNGIGNAGVVALVRSLSGGGGGGARPA
jgi:hypothetical protein